jgi:MraZ protein
LKNPPKSSVYAPGNFIVSAGFVLDSWGLHRYIFTWLVSKRVLECQMGFSGEYHVSVDAKGRVSIPSEFRGELAEQYASDSLVVTRIKDGLIAYPPTKWEEVCAQILALPAGKKRDSFMRVRIAPAKVCAFNAQGRIQVPQSLREVAGLEDNAVIVGLGDKIEIWSHAAHALRTAADEELLDEDPQLLADLGL